jgi:hypothetical protein
MWRARRILQSITAEIGESFVDRRRTVFEA